ncbi:hypothetical protein JOY44_28665 (plasmid) [Phormidium sp. CLA17]|uniref:hypothetical protein n=1 Tax=Leptolyngbya sp. Cla-17 TaxID=2803751 RepID=UPI0014919E74|nr:hypothetical protein [Leptolyngbya sp. Cla-17]MBM0745400.1 hypothetical protein [Leptolyngbya sp. Cla-17]
MSLDKETLKQDIKQAFKDAKETQAPKDPDPQKIDEIQNNILEKLSLDIAEAIDKFVKGGSVSDITVEVKDANNNMIGKGTQTGTGKIE